MAELSAKVEWYVGREVDFHKEVLLRQEANESAPHIVEWNIEDPPEPTEEQLEAAGIEHEAEEAATQYLRDRAAAYLPVQDQLYQIYDAMDKGEITIAKDFYKTIKIINDANPPPWRDPYPLPEEDD